MPVLLRFSALVAFVIGVAFCVVDDTPDVVDILGALLIGLAFWVASTLVPER